MATVYIQAHYLIDAIAGWISAIVIYFMLMAVSKKMK
jgi:membrane-associated phospholipid phosphatase